jgi:hypothetical protein
MGGSGPWVRADAGADAVALPRDRVPAYQIRRLWKEIRDDWEAHERMLANDPRNELPGSECRLGR